MRYITAMKKVLNNSWLWALLPTLAALAAALAGGAQYHPFPDSADYLALGGNFMSGFEYGTGIEPGWRTPGYPALLWLTGLVAGEYAYMAVNLAALYFFTVLMLHMAREFRISRIMVLALIAGSAGLLALAASALSEMPFLLFLTLNLELLRRREYLSSAAMLAVAAAIRPAAVLLWVPELLFALIALKPRMRWHRAVLFALAANLLVLVWCVRNQVVWGHFSYTSHEGNYVYFYKVGRAVAAANTESMDEARMRCAEELYRSMSERGENPLDIFAANAAAKRESAKYIMDHPGRFAAAMLNDLPNFWMPDITALLERLRLTSGNRGTLDVLHREGPAAAARHYFAGYGWKMGATVILYCMWYFAATLLAAAGMFKLAAARHWKTLAAALLLLGYFWLLPAGNLDWRFRMAAQPVLILCAAYAVSRRRRGSDPQSDAASENLPAGL